MKPNHEDSVRRERVKREKALFHAKLTELAQKSFDLGLRYLYGKGVERNPARACENFRAAADRHPDAAYTLAWLYERGAEGFRKDRFEAVKWYRAAAHRGHAKAQLRLGLMKMFGRVLKTNLEEALIYLRTAARQGNVEAMYFVGLLLFQNPHVSFRTFPLRNTDKVLRAGSNGRISRVPYSEVKRRRPGQCSTNNSDSAANWLRKAANRGHADAQYLLGRLHATGQVVAKDQTEAMKLYRQAADQGHAKAKEELAQTESASRAATHPAQPEVPSGIDPSDQTPAKKPVDPAAESAAWPKATAVPADPIAHNTGQQTEHDRSSPDPKLNHLTMPPTGQLFPGCTAVTSWLASRDQPANGLGWTCRVVTLGNGPFDEMFVDDLLRERDYVPFEPGAPDAGVMVVGRADWSPEDIQSQIDARQGFTLYIYSQEMAALTLLTGHDPFTASGDVLREMGRGHPALEYLMKNPFKWPSADCGTGGYIEIDAAEWHEHSPLTAMGYHVGREAHLPATARRALLRKIFLGHLRFPRGFSEREKREWGEPDSRQRLSKVVDQIARNISLRKNQLKQFRLAISQWASDLDWLRDQFYTRRFRFRWPDTSV